MLNHSTVLFFFSAERISHAPQKELKPTSAVKNKEKSIGLEPVLLQYIHTYWSYTQENECGLCYVVIFISTLKDMKWDDSRFIEQEVFL